MVFEQTMFKFVRVAAKGAVAGCVAILLARLHKGESVREKLLAAFGQLAREARAARKRVIKENLRFESVDAGDRQRRSIFGHQFTRLDFQKGARRLCQRFAESSKRDVGWVAPRLQLHGCRTAQREKQSGKA